MNFENTQVNNIQENGTESIQSPETLSLQIFHETALQRIQELEDSEVYPKWYADQRRDVLASFTQEIQDHDGINAENAKDKAVAFAEAVVDVFNDFRVKWDEKGKEQLEKLQNVFVTIDNGLADVAIGETAKKELAECRGRLETIIDDLVQYVVKVKKDVQIDEESASLRDELIKKVNVLSGDISAILGDRTQFTIDDSSEVYEEKENLSDLQDETIFDFLGKEPGPEPIIEIKEKVLERVMEFSELAGSLETISPERTAGHFVSYYFPIIEKIRQATNYNELKSALDLIDLDVLSQRFYSTYKKRRLGIFSKTLQIGNGHFPTNSEEYKALVSTQKTISLLATIESDIENT